MYKLWNMLAEMKSDAYEWVELSHSMNNDSPVWSGIPSGSVEVSKTVFDWGQPDAGMPDSDLQISRPIRHTY